MQSSKENIKNDLITLQKRRLIYQYILKNPGLHFLELVRKLNIPLSTLRYHLKYLESQELLVIKKDDKYVRYFVSGKLGDREKKILNIIRVKTTRDVLIYIMTAGVASQIELAKVLYKHPTTVRFHLKRLMKHGIIEQAPIGDGVIYTALSNDIKINREKSKNEVFYRLKEPEIGKLLVMYYNRGYYNDIISEAIFSYVDEVSPNGPPPRIKTAKEVAEDLEEILFDICPHPYHA